MAIPAEEFSIYKLQRVTVAGTGWMHVIDNNNISYQYAVIIVDIFFAVFLLFLFFGRGFKHGLFLCAHLCS